MIYVLYGPDQFRAREELRRIRAELDRDGNLAPHTLRLEGGGPSSGSGRGPTPPAGEARAPTRPEVAPDGTRAHTPLPRGGRAPSSGSGRSLTPAELRAACH